MYQQETVLQVTESVCPICLEKIPARYIRSGGEVYLKKSCRLHGNFSTAIWRGNGELSYNAWTKERSCAHPHVCLTEVNKGCPYDCGLCAEHQQQTCCVLLEVTERCNLNCNVCFAGSGVSCTDPSFETIKAWLEQLVALGKPFIHISGGEPTVRKDLPEIISLAREMGFPYIQLNTNGLRLGLEPEYVKELKDAGLSAVFMQFDGTRDEIYRQLRGRSLMTVKESAIENCGKNNLGIVLVPTVVPGVNADNIGEIVQFALARIPTVSGIHFQPVSYFGRYPAAPLDEQRITLPEVIRNMEIQTNGLIKAEYFKPSGCDHARCGFHGDFVLSPDDCIHPLSKRSEPVSCCSKQGQISAVDLNRNFVARRWVKNENENNYCQTTEKGDMQDMDYFLSRVRTHGFTITGMAFQDCWTIDLERLQECSLHVFSPDGRIIPFCVYNLTNIQGESLYRMPGQLSQIHLMELKKRNT